MRLVPERSPFPRLLVFPLAVVLLFGAYLSHTRADRLHEAAHCRLRDLTGVACPTCGGTLAAVSLARGQWTTALKANPVVAVALVWLVLWVVWGLVATAHRPWRRQLDLSATEKRAARIAVGAAILLGWVHQIVRVG